MRGLVIVLALFVAACRGERVSTSTTTPAAPDRDAEERWNLLNIARGAAVVSRTGELTLEQSAVSAIDGDATSWWTSPPADPQQTLLFSLPALTRIERIAIRGRPGPDFAVRDAVIETSTDGARFTPRALPLQSPADGRYIRVTTGAASGRFVSIVSVQLGGRYLEPPAVADISGCWTINGEAATFTRSAGGDVTGTIGEMVLQGGREGTVYRFAWSRGGQWGYALVTLSPDGKRLSGIKWHQEPIAYDFGDSWFGERCAAAPAFAPPADKAGAPLARFFSQARRYPLYGDPVAAINRVPGRIRLVSHEFRGRTAEENRMLAKQRLDALRAELQRRGIDMSRMELVVSGSDNPHQPIENESMRVLYGAIEIEQ